MGYADCHLHSIHSFDASESATVENIIRSAEKKDLFFIAITDHYDINNDYEKNFPLYDKEKAFDDINEKIASYKGKVKVSYGIELGEITQYEKDGLDFIEKYKPSTIVGSLHNVKGEKDFSEIKFKNMDLPEIYSLFDRYFDELVTLADYKCLDIIAHIMYPLRYVVSAGKTLDVSKYLDKTETLFKKMVKNDICLECNTSAWYREEKGYMRIPVEEKLFSLYKECGGRLVTLGSDAHTPIHMGGAFDVCSSMLKKIGFPECAFVYDKQIETYRI